MKCPVDGAALVMTERSGVEIDYCPQCRGVWLDRGELDKILDRASPVALEEPRRGGDDRRDDRGDDYRDGRREGYEGRREWRGDDDDGYRRHKKRRGGLLGDIFDF